MDRKKNERFFLSHCRLRQVNFTCLIWFIYFPMMERYNINFIEDYIFVLSTLNILVKEMSQKTPVLAKKILVNFYSKILRARLLKSSVFAFRNVIFIT
jgi:hypothetical protein